MSLLIVLGLVAFGLRANAKELEVTSMCTPPEMIINGSSSTMNCSFRGDIKDMDIIVQLFHPNSSKPVTVADCYLDNGGSHTCEISRKGVNFTLIPGKEQSVGILQISNVTKECAGRYVCQTISIMGNQMCNPCVLNFEEKKEANSQNSEMTVPENEATMKKENMAPEKPETDQTSPRSPGVIGGAIVGAVCLLGLLVAGGFIIRRKRNGRNISQMNPIYNPVSTYPAVRV